MSNEITVTFSFAVSKGSFKYNYNPGAIQADLTGDGGGNPGLVTIGTSEEIIDFGDVSPGIILMRNLDPTNYVRYAIYSTSDPTTTMRGKLKPGGIVHVIGLDASGSEELRMLADTAACKVEIRGFED
jgi:hypothetical protein